MLNLDDIKKGSHIDEVELYNIEVGGEFSLYRRIASEFVRNEDKSPVTDEQREEAKKKVLDGLAQRGLSHLVEVYCESPKFAKLSKGQLIPYQWYEFGVYMKHGSPMSIKGPISFPRDETGQKGVTA